jgi:hypothetical protein
MYRLLMVAFVLCVAFVACEFAGAVLQQRAQDRRAMEEREVPSAVAVTPSGRGPTAESRP